MLNLDTKIVLNKNAIQDPNLASRFSKEDLTALGNHIWAGYARDKQSRSQWLTRNEAGMDLALQLQKDKSFPWPGCANIAFPLVTIAALRFHAEAYSTLVQGTDIVKMRVIGEDPTGQIRQRADRISTHMSYQVLEEDKAWEEQHDKLLLNLAIVGSAFSKSYFTHTHAHNTSELVLARDLVMNYHAKSVESCMRKTHIVPLFRNEIYERVQRDMFTDVLDAPWYTSMPANTSMDQTARSDARRGEQPPQADEDTPFISLEQHCWLDLDGDGYAEPYIVTQEETSKAILRIVARFEREEDIERRANKQIIKIRATEYFTKYSFIPSPDGGIYDIGFGVLLGPLNESVNSIINQLVDAGTMATTAGGFLGRGAKIRGGVYTFSPLEWKRIDSTGDDIRKNLFPLPVREPSPVLFQLLGLLISYTDRVSGTTDTMVGENPGQNTPAETSRTMIAQGMKVYSSIFKRVWRSMKEEFKKLYMLNSIYLPMTKRYGEKGSVIHREDYAGDPDQVVPAADPNLASDAMRMQQAMLIRQSSMEVPGYDRAIVEKNFLKAAKVDGIDTFYPGPDKVPPLPNPKMAVEQMKLEGKKIQFQFEQQKFVAELQEKRRVNSAEITKLEAEVAQIIAEIGAAKAGQQIAAFDAAIGALKAHDESLRGHIELAMKGMENDRENAGREGVSGVVAAPGNAGGAGNAASMGAGA